MAAAGLFLTGGWRAGLVAIAHRPRYYTRTQVKVKVKVTTEQSRKKVEDDRATPIRLIPPISCTPSVSPIQPRLLSQPSKQQPQPGSQLRLPSASSVFTSPAQPQRAARRSSVCWYPLTIQEQTHVYYSAGWSAQTDNPRSATLWRLRNGLAPSPFGGGMQHRGWWRERAW